MKEGRVSHRWSKDLHRCTTERRVAKRASAFYELVRILVYQHTYPQHTKYRQGKLQITQFVHSHGDLSPWEIGHIRQAYRTGVAVFNINYLKR